MTQCEPVTMQDVMDSKENRHALIQKRSLIQTRYPSELQHLSSECSRLGRSLSKLSGSRMHHPSQEDPTKEAPGEGQCCSRDDIYINPHKPASAVEYRAGWSVFTAAEQDWTSMPGDVWHWLELCALTPNTVAPRLRNGLAA